MDTFGARIKMLREQRDMNQADLAPLIGSSRSAISTYENGLTPPVNVVIGCAKFFNVSTDYLLGLTDEKKPMSSDELSKKFDRLSTLAGKHAVTQSDISEVIEAMIKYYRSGAKASHAPADALRAILSEMAHLFVSASGNNFADVLSATNSVSRLVLDISNIVQAYLGNETKE